jgi:N6-L-threonylcarbamoyladenine synthase
MKILGIETSCDETAAAVVEDGKKILSSVVTSSENLHKRFGGIIPEQAAREQLKVIIPIIDQALGEAKLGPAQLDTIAVTYGPGLIGSLIVGVEAAKTLSFSLTKPLIPVNHLLGHIYANFLQPTKIPLPAICLVVSGGHTDLLLMKAEGRNPRSLTESQDIGMDKKHRFTLLGSTRDDAAGECLDKTARVLGLGYPGGPEIEKASAQLTAKSYKLKADFKLPRPMMHEDNFDFSFSGLKTAVLDLVKKSGTITEAKRNTIAYEIQEAITEVLVTKTLRAAEEYHVKSILVGGGVAANSRLREKFQLAIIHYSSSIKFFVPLKNLCTDNGAVIAATAFYQNQPIYWRNLKPIPSLHFSFDAEAID